MFLPWLQKSLQASTSPPPHRIQMTLMCVRYQENAGADYSQGRARCPVPAHGPQQPCNSTEEKQVTSSALHTSLGSEWWTKVP